jgi:hypothetical protein
MIPFSILLMCAIFAFSKILYISTLPWILHVLFQIHVSFFSPTILLPLLKQPILWPNLFFTVISLIFFLDFLFTHVSIHD